MNEKSPVKSYCGGKPNYCTPEETDNVGACVTCGAPKNKWLVDAVNMTPDRVDETAKDRHEPDEDIYDIWVEQGTCQQNRQVAKNATTWVGLTDEEIYDYADKFLYQHGSNYGIKSFGKAIEAKLKEKNT